MVSSTAHADGIGLGVLGGLAVVPEEHPIELAMTTLSYRTGPVRVEAGVAATQHRIDLVLGARLYAVDERVYFAGRMARELHEYGPARMSAPLLFLSVGYQWRVAQHCAVELELGPLYVMKSEADLGAFAAASVTLGP